MCIRDSPQALLYALPELFTRGAAELRELFCGIIRRFLPFCKLGFEFAALFFGAVQLLQAPLRSLQQRGEAGLVCAVFFLQPPELTEARLQRVVLAGGKVQALPEITQALRRVLYRGAGALYFSQGLVQLRSQGRRALRRCV